MELDPDTVALRAATNCTKCGHAARGAGHYPSCPQHWNHPDKRTDYADIPDPAARTDCPGCASASVDHGRVYAHTCGGVIHTSDPHWLEL